MLETEILLEKIIRFWDMLLVIKIPLGITILFQAMLLDIKILLEVKILF